jgi:hypothetical protein
MSALGGVYSALKTAIAADSGVAALLAAAPFAGAGVNGKAVYDEGAVPQLSAVPYLTVGAGTEFPQSTFRSRGWNCTVQVKVTARGSEASGHAIVEALSALLLPPGPYELTVIGFTRSWVDEFTLQPTLIELIAGVTTRSWPVILRVMAT